LFVEHLKAEYKDIEADKNPEIQLLAIRDAAILRQKNTAFKISGK